MRQSEWFEVMRASQSSAYDGETGLSRESLGDEIFGLLPPFIIKGVGGEDESVRGSQWVRLSIKHGLDREVSGLHFDGGLGGRLQNDIGLITLDALESGEPFKRSVSSDVVFEKLVLEHFDSSVQVFEGFDTGERFRRVTPLGLKNFDNSMEYLKETCQVQILCKRGGDLALGKQG